MMRLILVEQKLGLVRSIDPLRSNGEVTFVMVRVLVLVCYALPTRNISLSFTAKGEVFNHHVEFHRTTTNIIHCPVLYIHPARPRHLEKISSLRVPDLGEV
jgi:hypothetical protein